MGPTQQRYNPRLYSDNAPSPQTELGPMRQNYGPEGGRMNCPGCQQAMEPVPLEGTYRGPMTIDVCTACRGFWFDAGEQFRLTPATTLLLVRRVEASRDKTRQRMWTRPRCARCNLG